MTNIKIHEKGSLTRTTEFLVPFTKTIVDLLSNATIKEWVLVKELKTLHMEKVNFSDGAINTTNIVENFSVSILYVGIRNFILTIRGIEEYDGFCIIVTNKGIVVNDNSSETPKDLAKDLKQSFLSNYKSPYLITDTFLKFRNESI